jgi:hypothetical protein
MSGYFNFGKYKKSVDRAIDTQSKGEKVKKGTAGNPGGVKKKKKKKSTY